MNLGFPTAASDLNATTDTENYKGLDFLKQENPKLFYQIM